MNFIKNNKKGLIIGFVAGALLAPILSTLGLINSFFETLRPLLIGPMDIIASLIPDVQTGPNSYYAPVYKWILALGFNGIVYSILGGIIQSFKRSDGKK